MPTIVVIAHMLTRRQIYKLVNDYIGTYNGYLCGFSYRTHAEFYPHYCDLDIDPNQYSGTTRERFLTILEKSDTATQAKIIQGVLEKFPLDTFSEEEQADKQILYNEFKCIIEQLHADSKSRTGAEGKVKNLIFAANGPKPDIILSDSVSNKIQIVANAQYCLIYDQSIPDTGLRWLDLVHWWARQKDLPFPHRESESELYKRLHESLASPPEKFLFRSYFKTFRRVLDEQLPALIPQVYLHYDPKTVKELKGTQRLPRQRMDFLLLFSNQDRVVVEVDGQHHYADDKGASPQRYASMAAADRELRLQGYDVYRFGAFELQHENSEQVVNGFFRKLLGKYGILP